MPLHFVPTPPMADEPEIPQIPSGYTLDYRSEDEPDVPRSMVVGTRYNFLDIGGETTPAVLTGIILGHGTLPEGDSVVTSNPSMISIPMNALVSISPVPASSASSSSSASRGISAPAAGGRRKSRRKYRRKSRRKKRKKTRKRIYKKYKRKKKTKK